jgi:spermidine/putrescine transport system substrate-binding protein
MMQGVGLTLLGATGCRKKPDLPTGQARTLRLLAWSRFFDARLLSQFEAKHQCQLVVSSFETNEELFARLDADSAAYDVVTPSSYMTSQLVAEKLLMELDADKLELPGNEAMVAGKPAGSVLTSHAASYSWSANGIACHAKYGSLPSRSWRVFDDETFKRRFTLLGDIRELLGAGLKACGKSANSTSETDLNEAAEVVGKWISNARKLDTEAYTYALIAGEDLAAQGYNGDVWIARQADADLRFFIPDEGTTLAVDELCLSSGCNQVDLAHAFVSFMCRPENARQNMAWSGYLSVNADVVSSLPELSKELLVDQATPLENSEMIAPLGEGNRLWEAVWQKLFNSQI